METARKELPKVSDIYFLSSIYKQSISINYANLF